MMKNNLFLGLAIITLLFSCTTDDTADIVINDNSVTNNTLAVAAVKQLNHLFIYQVPCQLT